MSPKLTFSDEDLKRLKDCINSAGVHSSHYTGECLGEDGHEALLARLEAIESVVEGAKRVQYDDGLVMYDFNFSTPEVVKKMDVWRKSSGKPTGGGAR